MKLHILLSYVQLQKPIEFGAKLSVFSSVLVWMCVKMFGCPSVFSKTSLPTFMKLHILLSYVQLQKPVEFGAKLSTLTG